MVGIIKPSDLRDVSHDSVYALLLRMDGFAEYLSGSVSYLLTSNQKMLEKVSSIGQSLAESGTSNSFL